MNQDHRARGAGALPALCAVLALPLLSAQEPTGPGKAGGQEPAKTQPAGQPAQDRPAKLTEWPTPKPADRDKLQGLVGLLKKEAAEVQQKGRDGLIAIGDSATGYLLQQVNDHNEALNAQIFSVFDKTLGAQHAALMARECKKNKVELRRYFMHRMCRFLDPDLAPVFRAAITEKAQHEDVVFDAQLALAALRDAAAFPALLEASLRAWDERRAAIIEVLPAARCEDCGVAMADLVAKKPPAEQAAGLRLMRYLATKEQAMLVRGYLSAQDHVVKKEAVNAMRALNGMEPIENLDAFRTIEMAKEWLSK